MKIEQIKNKVLKLYSKFYLWWYEKSYYEKIVISAIAIIFAAYILLWLIKTGFIFFGFGIFTVGLGINYIVDNESKDITSGICGVLLILLGFGLIYFCTVQLGG